MTVITRLYHGHTHNRNKKIGRKYWDGVTHEKFVKCTSPQKQVGRYLRGGEKGTGYFFIAPCSAVVLEAPLRREFLVVNASSVSSF